MTPKYNLLAPSLHATADAAIAWFKRNWGINQSTIEIESAIQDDIQFRPTFQARTHEYHTLCIEVADTIYNPTLDSFVLDCGTRGLPVKLFVAVKRGFNEKDYATKLKDAKRAGVGILEVDDSSGNIIQNATSLSLTHVRTIEYGDFPPKYREQLQQAAQSFRDGQPPKACSQIYDELEGAFRRFAEKCEQKGLWQKPTSFDIQKVAWATLISNIDKHLDRSAPAARKITPALLARMHGMTTHRNDAGHKPRNLKELAKRDRELRTRFEGAVDLLHEFLSAASLLKP